MNDIGMMRLHKAIKRTARLKKIKVNELAKRCWDMAAAGLSVDEIIKKLNEGG
jgi:hypothetical protein